MERDTDQDWIMVGESDPYFGVAGDHRYHLAQDDQGLLDELYRGGNDEIERICRVIRNLLPDFRAESALDFGCGVGRHTLAMSAQAELVTGFDVAPAMIACAEKAAALRAISNCRFVADDLADEERFDWINSYQVFQHIMPERGYRLISDLFDRLSFGGVCSLHVALFRERRHLPLEAASLWQFDGRQAGALVQRPQEGVGQFALFDYDLNRILALMIAHQVELLSARMHHSGGHHGILLFGRKDPDGFLLRPGQRYEAHTSPSFEAFLGDGWSEIEEWGVWSSGAIATMALRIPFEFHETHVLKLYGQAFVNPQHPSILIDAVVNSELAVRIELAEPSDDWVLEIPLLAVRQDGTAAVRLVIDSPISPAACGVAIDDNRALGFGLEAMALEPR
jgi:SAM-dependent methyltransferase